MILTGSHWPQDRPVIAARVAELSIIMSRGCGGCEELFGDAVMSQTLPVKTVYYPESDGKPLGETDWHRQAIVRLIELFQQHFVDQIVYVSGDLLVYYEPGNPKKFVVPDVFIAKGVKPKARRIYKIWQEQHAPDAVIEVTSRKTRRKDHTTKPELYARLGVAEYFLFDPEQDYLVPPLQGFRLIDGEYQPITPNADGSLTSEQFGVRLRLEGEDLQLYHLHTGERLLTGIEHARQAEQHARQAAQQALQAEQQALQAEQQALQAEQRAAALQAELDQLRAKRVAR